MKFVLMILVFVTAATAARARQIDVPWDSSTITVRQFSGEAIRDYKSQKAFQYNLLQEKTPSLWDRFWSWFWWKVNQLLSTPGGKATLWTLFILFGAAMIILFVMKVTGMNRAGLFGRSSRDRVNYTTTADDIHAISFDEAIATAVSQGNYRLAVRLMYLQVLKVMADKGFIDWQLNKTNTDYVAEVALRSWKPGFEKLTHNFEYTWYGEAAISVETYQALQQQFQHFNRQLQ